MKYIALTQATAEWLLDRTATLEALSEVLISSQLAPLTQAAFEERGLNIVADRDGIVLAIWHDDYLSATGEADWGFIRFDQQVGLTEHPEINKEVLRRCLAVINQRLQSLRIDQAWFVRIHANGATTLSAGGGEEARKQSIGYFETSVQSKSGSRSHAIIIVGPAVSFDGLARLAAGEAQRLLRLTTLANMLILETRRRPLIESPDFAALRGALRPSSVARDRGYADVDVPVETIDEGTFQAYATSAYSYETWSRADSTLTETQRNVLESDIITQYPVRIMGPAGSGKTLLLQLLAIRRLRQAERDAEQLAVLYITHNAAMAENVVGRFEVLGADQYLLGEKQRLVVETLSAYARRALGLEARAVVDVDAHQTKQFQFEVVVESLAQELHRHPEDVKSSKLLSQIANSTTLHQAFAGMLMAEFSIAIKGHELVNDEKRYVESERQLSRLHGQLSPAERRFVFSVFRRYHRTMFEEMGYLDADDVALSLFGTLRTPIWNLRRKIQGFDHVFVDETQLFNENERRVFPLLTKGTTTHVPIVVALDGAQEVFGQNSAGFGALGISDIQDESLEVSQRSTSAILELSFFLIERTKHLFEGSFPSYPESAVANIHPLARFPKVERYRGDTNYAKFILRTVRELRKENVWQIGVVCHAEIYWKPLVDELQASNLPLQVLLQRGERVAIDQPVVVLTRPAYVGGQEFDAIVSVGLEEGLVPPRVTDNESFAYAVEQQALREMYIAFTRARYRLVITLPANARPSAMLQAAVEAGLLADETDQLTLPM